MARTSSAQRTIRALKQQGYLCGMVERFNPHAGPFGIRQDLFGFIDLIAIKPIGICAVQACGSDFKAHDIKIRDIEEAHEWLKAGGSIELWGWRKIKKVRGGKQMVWKPRIKVYTLEDFT